MKCHYTYYVDNGKKKRCFIPYCMGGEFHGKDGCTCRDEFTFERFERDKYNEKLEELISQIKDLEEENKYLIDVIKKVKIVFMTGYLIKIKSSGKDCFISDVDGDPGRTLTRSSAKVFKSKYNADKAKQSLAKEYLNREFKVVGL